MFTVKFASTDKAAALRIMNDIYGENPHYWPYGLNARPFDDLYLVKDANTGGSVGFVGWQEFSEGRKKVGYYAIGVLPEYRQLGAGREAVKQLLMTKAAGVDEVRAMIREGNAPSIARAASLNVPIEKVAMTIAQKVWRYARPGLAGTAAMAASDTLMYGGSDGVKNYLEGLKTPGVSRVGKALVNFGLGATYGHHATPSEWRTKLLNSFFLKELVLQGVEHIPAAVGAASTAAGAEALKGESLSRVSKALPWIAGGALGLGGLGLLLKSRQGPPQGTTVIQQGSNTPAEQGGKLRVTLPTRNPGDQETQLELPFSPETVNLSTALQGKLLRDTRRRLLAEVDSRTYRKDSPNNKEKQQVA